MGYMTLFFLSLIPGQEESWRRVRLSFVAGEHGEAQGTQVILVIQGCRIWPMVSQGATAAAVLHGESCSLSRNCSAMFCRAASLVENLAEERPWSREGKCPQQSQPAGAGKAGFVFKRLSLLKPLIIPVALL
ncbi:unnamed protein product [Eretmochelys imbricata]